VWYVYTVHTFSEARVFGQRTSWECDVCGTESGNVPTWSFGYGDMSSDPDSIKTLPGRTKRRTILA
jgi:hypothetical protein